MTEPSEGRGEPSVADYLRVLRREFGASAFDGKDWRRAADTSAMAVALLDHLVIRLAHDDERDTNSTALLRDSESWAAEIAQVRIEHARLDRSEAAERKEAV